MAKATGKATTPNMLTPEKVEYVAADEILVSLRSNTGALVTYTLSTAAMMAMTNMSVSLINGFTAQVLRDLGAM